MYEKVRVRTCLRIVRKSLTMLLIIRMEPYQVARIGTTASHFSALVYSLVWISNDEVPSVATLLSFGLVYLGE
jgi:hypothetical protein